MGNSIHDAFDNIKADPQMKEATKRYFAVRYQKKNSLFANRTFHRTFAAACAMLLLIVGFGGYHWTKEPVSYVSIDINPSVELGLNRFERVVSAVAYNPEGEEILQGLSLKGKEYTEAIDLIVGSEAMAPYLEKEDELVFTVAAQSSREKVIEAGVAHCSGHIGHSSHSVSADMETVNQAHDNGMSVGKYNAYLQLSEYDSTVTVDECKHMSMSQIHGMISEHGQEEGCHHAQQGDSDDGSSQGMKQDGAGDGVSQEIQQDGMDDGISHGMQQESTGNGNGQEAHQQDSSGDGYMEQGGHHRRGHH